MKTIFAITPMDTLDSLLLAAFEPELAGLGDIAPKGWRVALTGIGGITAAATTGKLLEEMCPQRVLFIGTCGAYGNKLNVGDCIAVSEVVATSVSEIQRRAFRPSIETTRWTSTWDLALPKAVVAAVPAITSSQEDAALLAQIADAEHLEIAGVFAACHLAKIPVAAVLGVANQTGSEAHTEWLANHESVSQKLVGILDGLLFQVR